MSLDIDKYLKDHLPYSLEIMLSHQTFVREYHEKIINNSQILRGVFVGSITKGRMLLEVIGIKLHANGEIQTNPTIQKDKAGEDSNNISVYADDLRGKMADVDKLTSNFPEEMENIKHYLIAANKYELHLTKQRYDRDLNRYNMAIPFIVKLIDDHIYLSTKDNEIIRSEMIRSSRTFRNIFSYNK